MWPWRPNDMPKRWALWLKLCALSCFVHTLVLAFIFFIFRGSGSVYNIEIAQRIRDAGVPVIFLPLQKKVVDQKVARGNARNKKNSAKKSTAVKKKQPKKQKTTLASATPKKQEIAKRVEPKKAETKKVEPVKVAAKKIEPIPDKIAPLVKKVAQQKPKPELKKETLVAKQDKKPEQPAPALAQAIDVESEVEPLPEAIYIGQHELDALRMQEFMHEEILTHWRPPVGIAKNCVCEIKMLVDWQGHLKNIEVCKPSGVLIYDVSARTALQSIKELPRWVRGKEFVISFKQ